MPIIKAHDAADLASKEATLECVKSSAAAIVERARADATRVIAMAIEEARLASGNLREEARKEGYEAGRVEGFEEGLAQGRSEAEAGMRDQLESLHASWMALLDDWAKHEPSRRERLGQQAIELAMKLSERIIHRQVEQDPSIIVDQIRHALDLAQSPADLEIIVAATDRERVHKVLPGLLERFESMGYVSIRGCSDMTPGGCRLKMKGGEVDASLEVQLQRVTEALLPDRREPPHSVLEPEGEAA